MTISSRLKVLTLSARLWDTSVPPLGHTAIGTYLTIKSNKTLKFHKTLGIGLRESGVHEIFHRLMECGIVEKGPMKFSRIVSRI